MNDKALTTVIDDTLSAAMQNKTLKDVESISINSDTLLNLNLSNSILFKSTTHPPTYRGFAITVDESLAANEVRLNKQSK